MELAGYREWDGRRRSPWRSCWAIVRVGLGMILRRWVFWGLIGLGLLFFLFTFAIIYLKATINVRNPGVAQFLDQVQVTGTGQAYRDFMQAQASITALLLAFAASTLIGSDYRHGGMVYYLSRRIERRHYIAAKLTTVSAIVTIITTIPALLLFLEYGVLTNSLDYFWDNPRILGGILGYGTVLAIVQSLVLFAIAAWVPRTVPLVMSWLGIYVLLRALAAALEEINDNKRWRLLGLWENMNRVGDWCFGDASDGAVPTVGHSAAVLGAVCAVSLVLIMLRVRAVEVVR
jgi:ABC-type transport system involved in multi-copper enzyme maturation permease subunit